MKPKDRDYNLYFEGILTSMERIEEYIGEMDFQKIINKFYS